MARTEQGLKEALDEIPTICEEFWKDVRVTGEGKELNLELERAGRVADFIDFAQLMCRDALDRDESCGGHFRAEHQSGEGEAVRNDDDFAHVSVWQYEGDGKAPTKHKEELEYKEVHFATRSYK